MNDYVLIII